MASEQPDAVDEDTVDLTEVRRALNEAPRTAFTTGDVRAVLNGKAPAPRGVHPDTIAALRRIARRFNGI
jgi:hypothetical protein